MGYSLAESLPPDILSEILGRLHGRDWLVFPQVCKAWRDHMIDRGYMHKVRHLMLNANFGCIKQDSLNQILTWLENGDTEPEELIIDLPWKEVGPDYETYDSDELSSILMTVPFHRLEVNVYQRIGFFYMADCKSLRFLKMIVEDPTYDLSSLLRMGKFSRLQELEISAIPGGMPPMSGIRWMTHPVGPLPRGQFPLNPRQWRKLAKLVAKGLNCLDMSVIFKIESLCELVLYNIDDIFDQENYNDTESKLQKLTIAKCGLKKLHATFATHCPHIKELDLSGNEFTEVPSVIGHRWNLKSLDLSLNELRTMSECLFSLKDLETLNLSCNADMKVAGRLLNSVQRSPTSCFRKDLSTLVTLCPKLRYLEFKQGPCKMWPIDCLKQVQSVRQKRYPNFKFVCDAPMDSFKHSSVEYEADHLLSPAKRLQSV